MKIPRSPRLYRPTKVTEVELTEAFGDLTVPEGYEAVKVLVRFHRVPVGYVSPPITSGCCTARSIITAALEQHSWRILCQLLRMALHSPQFRAGLTPADLPKIIPPPFQGPFPLVTVIVCTRDRTDDLGHCLDSFSRLDYPNLELLVIDNAPSTNATEQLVRARYQSVKYLRELTPGLSHARNLGIAEASGALIAFTDDDVVADPGWVSALAKLFVESPEVMAITGFVVPFELETEPQALFELQGGFGRGFDRKWYQVEPGNTNRSELHHGAGKFGTGANMAFRKQVFDRVGLFDVALGAGTVTCGGDDIDMFFRIIQEGHILVYEPAVLVYHRHRRDYAGLRKQIEGNGLGLSSFHVRNSRAYPSERRAFARLWRWWLMTRHIKPLLKSFTHPRLYPRDLILTELRGYLAGLRRYHKAVASTPDRTTDARDRRANFAELSTWRKYSPHFSAFPLKEPVRDLASALGVLRSNLPVAVREVDLGHPLRALTDLAEYGTVRVVVRWDSRPLGQLDIANCGMMVSVSRLRQAIADRFTFQLFEPDPLVSNEFMRAKAMSTLGQHFRCTEQGTFSRPSSWLIDLARPLAAFPEAQNWNHTRAHLSREGSPVGEVQINNYRQPISLARLRDALVENMGLKLLDVPTHVHKDLLWSHAVTVLLNHYRPNIVSATNAAALLPTHMSVSIVIATRDRPEDLRNCLRAVCAQKTSRRVEVVVVDNRPASKLTPVVASEFPEIVLIQEHRQGLSYARNAGICASTGDIIIATDDDVTMPSDWLEKLVAPFRRDDVMIVTGNVLPLELENLSQQRFEQYGGLGRGFKRFEANREWFDSFPRQAVPTWRLGATANAAFRAAIFHHPAIGMLDEALGAGMPSGCSEDTDLFYRVLQEGYTILYEPTAYVWHNHRKTPQALRKQLYNYSKGGVGSQLVTLFRDKDLRALYRIFVELPRVHWWRIKQRLLGKSDYPLRLIAIEILGNLMGPWALWRSRWRVARRGRSAPYMPVWERAQRQVTEEKVDV